MRILHVCDGMPPQILGGAGGIMQKLATEQARQGHDVHVLSASSSATPMHDHPWTNHVIPKLGIRFSHYRSVFSGRREREVMAVIKEVSPDVVHAHAIAFQIGYRWMPAARKAGIRVVGTFHDAMHIRYGKVTGRESNPALDEFRRFRWSYNPLRNALIASYLRSADALVAVSDALREYVQPLTPKSIQTIHNGIDLDFWKPTENQRAARQALELPIEAPIFLIAGRLGGSKGLPLALTALPRNALLLVAGEVGTLATRDRRCRVFERQSQEAMKRLYLASDAVLVPSNYLDPFPTVCLEAMASGRPVIATSMGGAKEAVSENETGWILDPDDSGAWASRMEWCALNRNDMTEIGKAARRLAEARFDVKYMAKNMERIYSHARDAAL